MNPLDRAQIAGDRPSQETGVLIRMSDVHHTLADLILEDPSRTNAQLGAMIGRSPHWVGVIRNTDLFKTHMAIRRTEVEDSLVERIKKKTGDAVNSALDRVIGALKEEDVDARYALDAADKLMKHRFGTGVAVAGAAAASAVTVNISASELLQAQEIIREHAKNGSVVQFPGSPEGGSKNLEPVPDTLSQQASTDGDG